MSGNKEQYTSRQAFLYDDENRVATRVTRTAAGSGYHPIPWQPVQPATVALLNPEEFDNNYFWHQVEQAGDNVDQIQLAAIKAGFTDTSDAHPNHKYPRISDLLVMIALHCRSPQQIITSIKNATLTNNDLSWMDSYATTHVTETEEMDSYATQTEEFDESFANEEQAPPQFLGRKPAFSFSIRNDNDSDDEEYQPYDGRSALHARHDALQVKYRPTAAVLCPAEFDNYAFWKAIYSHHLARTDIENIETAAYKAGLSEKHPNPDILYPICAKLLRKIAEYCVYSNEIIEIIKSTALDLEADLSWMDHYILSEDKLDPDWPIDDSDNEEEQHVFLYKEEVIDKILDMRQGTSSPRNNPGASLCLRILAGLLLVGGTVAIVAALVTLQAAALNPVGLVVAGLGMVSVLGGIGLFRNANAPRPPGQQEPSCLDRLNPFRMG